MHRWEFKCKTVEKIWGSYLIPLSLFVTPAEISTYGYSEIFENINNFKDNYFMLKITFLKASKGDDKASCKGVIYTKERQVSWKACWWCKLWSWNDVNIHHLNLMMRSLATIKANPNDRLLNNFRQNERERLNNTCAINFSVKLFFDSVCTVKRSDSLTLIMQLIIILNLPFVFGYSLQTVLGVMMQNFHWVLSVVLIIVF